MGVSDHLNGVFSIMFCRKFAIKSELRISVKECEGLLIFHEFPQLWNHDKLVGLVDLMSGV